jgi:hypothetical protein
MSGTKFSYTYEKLNNPSVSPRLRKFVLVDINEDNFFTDEKAVDRFFQLMTDHDDKDDASFYEEYETAWEIVEAYYQ